MPTENNNNIPPKQRVTYLRRRIINWYKETGRDYPWRSTADPYRILIAEMMLQRTRADQVAPVYREFFSKFEAPKTVAETPQEELNEILEPLGLRWRFKRFKQVSQVLDGRFDGKVPDNRTELSQLPGVGQYVSGLVASVAFNRKAWIVDSNVVRVFERFFGLDTKEEARRDDQIIETAKKYINTTKPRASNLGLVDFGALVCKPNSMRCNDCPARRKCLHYKGRKEVS